MTNTGFWVQEKSPRTGGEWKEIFTAGSRAAAGIYMLKCSRAAIWDMSVKTPIEFRIVNEEGEEA